MEPIRSRGDVPGTSPISMFILHTPEYDIQVGVYLYTLYAYISEQLSIRTMTCLHTEYSGVPGTSVPVVDIRHQ